MYQNGSYGYQQPHAPRKITEYPSWVSVPENDPRVRHKEIDYDANGNQTEIKEKVGEEYVSLRKNLWDEENRLVGVDLNPDEETGHPIAVYTYDAGGERVIKYNLDRIDVSSNATEVGQETKDNVMIYPSGLLMGKVTKISASENRFIYTKHYYMGTERMSAKTGTFRDLGLYPDKMVLDKFPGINPSIIRNLSNQSVDDAETIVSYVYGQFDQTANIPQFNSFTEGILDDRSTHDPKLYDAFYFHPDQLGSSSYISNLAGNVSQHIEYMPFGEILVDEHINSFNTPFKFNGKEYDEETGNYYYSARYYDPKWSIFISVDPLAEKTMSSYGYCYNNPIIYTDPDGRDPIYGKNFWGRTKLIGDDGKNDGQSYLVRGVIKRDVKKATKAGENYKGSLAESDNVFKIPTGGVMDDVISSVNDTKTSQKEHGGHANIGDSNATRWDEGPAAIGFTDKDGNLGAKATLTMFKIGGKNKMPSDASNVEYWWHTHPKTSVNGLLLGSSNPSPADFKGQTEMIKREFKGNTFVIGVRSGTVTFYNGKKPLITVKYSDFKTMGGK
ncbi:RHS repeat-associated core domain-containing protein [Flavobacterium sp. ST-75]|uniref:RHS repeat-associated core domain-containing protein n=1 Tax=Flavobacterium rhizophilum TaxID=3163296 RepID=A0ABW8YAZ8_9FLAO